jgi:hypothetical protein
MRLTSRSPAATPDKPPLEGRGEGQGAVRRGGGTGARGGYVGGCRQTCIRGGKGSGQKRIGGWARCACGGGCRKTWIPSRHGVVAWLGHKYVRSCAAIEKTPDPWPRGTRPGDQALPGEKQREGG